MEKDIYNRVRSFISDMNGWESWCGEKFGTPSFDVSSTRKVKAVFDEHCTQRERKFGRNGTFRTPPEYDLGTETFVSVAVEESSDKATVVTVRDDGMVVDRKYRLFCKGGVWLIDSVMEKYEDDDWEQGIL